MAFDAFVCSAGEAAALVVGVGVHPLVEFGWDATHDEIVAGEVAMADIEKLLKNAQDAADRTQKLTKEIAKQAFLQNLFTTIGSSLAAITLFAAVAALTNFQTRQTPEVSP